MSDFDWDLNDDFGWDSLDFENTETNKKSKDEDKKPEEEQLNAWN